MTRDRLCRSMVRRALARVAAVRRDGERGSAVLELVALSVVVLAPLVLGVAAMSLVQRASYAASGAARDAARVFATSPDLAAAQARSQASARVVFDDYDVSQGDVQVACRGACLAPGTSVRAVATVVVPIPGLSAVLGRGRFTTVTITSSQSSPVDEYAVPR